MMIGFYQYVCQSVYVAGGHGSDLSWLHCDMLFTR